jgi:F0F1-type ATP synthase assembly protein I
MAKNSLNLQDFGPVSSFSTSIISGLLVGLLIQYFIGYEPVPVIIFVLIGIYDGSRRMWQISKKIQGK